MSDYRKEKNIDPDEYIGTLLSRNFRSDKKKRLIELHELLRNESKKDIRDFSKAHIGDRCEEKGIISKRTLYSNRSQDYCSLIDVWEIRYGSNRKERIKSDFDEIVEKIDDPALRNLLQFLTVENRKLIAENKILKNKSNIIIDMRPTKRNSIDEPSLFYPLTLTTQEIVSLEQTIDPLWLKNQSWRKRKTGEITNDSGRIIFDVGYSIAIKKVLEYLKRNDEYTKF